MVGYWVDRGGEAWVIGWIEGRWVIVVGNWGGRGPGRWAITTNKAIKY